jgi:hypothetical protein
MKYVAAFEYPASVDIYDTSLAFRVFDTTPHLPDLKFEGYFGRVDGQGGFAVIETDSPSALFRIGLRYQPFYACKFHPVLGMEEFASISRQVNQELTQIKSDFERDHPRTSAPAGTSTPKWP